MSPKRVLILGAGFMQGVAIRAAKAKGWRVVAVDGNPAAPCAAEADHFEPIDLKDRPALIEFARSLLGSGGLDGVFTAATDFSASVAAVAEACGLPGHGLEAALNASDKVRMRARFAEKGIPSPRYVGIRAGELQAAGQTVSEAEIGFPLVVKPADNMGARGCRLVAEPGDLGDAIGDSIRYSRSGTAIVEEYMDGPEFSIEGLVFDGEFHLTGLADRHIFFPPYFIEMGHTIPSSYSGADAEPIIDVFRRGVKALGLSHGAVKGDIKLTSRGAMVGEIAGRLSGGYMSGWTFPYSSGIDLTSAALDLAVGSRPEALVPSRCSVSAERAWISAPGTVAEVIGLEAARGMPNIEHVFPRSAPGDQVNFPRNNVEKCGNVIAVADSREVSIRAAEAVAASIAVRLAPRDPATDSFMNSATANPSGFPPAAFDFGIPPCGIDGERTRPLRLDDGAAIQVPESVFSKLDTLSDWQGRTPREALRFALGIEPRIAGFLVDSNPSAGAFWRAFAAAGYQGLLYVHDSTK